MDHEHEPLTPRRRRDAFSSGRRTLADCSGLDNCPDGQPTRVITTGISYTDPILAYESAPLNGPLDEFPVDTDLVFVHHLGVTPEFPATELSFKRDGISSGDVTQNAGSGGLITCVDDHVIIVKNGTCEKGFFIRVTALATGKTTGFAECQFDTHCAL